MVLPGWRVTPALVAANLDCPGSRSRRNDCMSNRSQLRVERLSRVFQPRVLRGVDAAIARLALILVRAPYQFSEELARDVTIEKEDRFIRILVWASCSAARHDPRRGRAFGRAPS
jgi:hypothetical protein